MAASIVEISQETQQGRKIRTFEEADAILTRGREGYGLRFLGQLRDAVMDSDGNALAGRRITYSPEKSGLVINLGFKEGDDLRDILEARRLAEHLRKPPYELYCVAQTTPSTPENLRKYANELFDLARELERSLKTQSP